MATAAAHEGNYPGRYVVPPRNDPQGGFLPRGPPLPDPSNPNVLRFTTLGVGVGNSRVIDHTNTEVYHFQSPGVGHLEMYDAEDKLVARYSDDQVVYRGGGPIKRKKFIKHAPAGKTGRAIVYDGVEYEIVQELFYAIVRSVTTCERVAIIYNYTGKLAVEMTEMGVGNDGLQTNLVFIAALLESKVMKRGPGLGMAIRNIIRRKGS